MHVNTLRCVTVLTVWTGIAAGSGALRPWTPPVNLGTAVNSPLRRGQPFVSKDGLSLYFMSGLSGRLRRVRSHVVSSGLRGPTPGDRPETWDPPINTAFTETNPEQSHDGRQLFFASNRPGGSGLVDLLRHTTPQQT